MIEPRQK